MINIYRTKLVVRIAVFFAAVGFYLREKGSLIFTDGELLLYKGIKPVHVIWLIILAGMVPKFFPEKGNSIGCRKQFRSGFEPSNQRVAQTEMNRWMHLENRAAFKVFALWFGVNSFVAFLYFAKIIGQPELILLSLFYLVCDMICLLVWCPFQYFIMKNRCCVTCRIFNWDSIMACTPLLFVRSFFSWSLVFVALFLLFRWEYSYWKHPWRFFEESNVKLQCRYCNEKICKTKKSIQMRHIHSHYSG